MLRKLWPSSQEKRRLRGDLITTFQYLKELTRKPERDSSTGTVVIAQGVMGAEREGKLRLATGKKFFAARVVRNWHRLPSDFLGAPAFAGFKATLNRALSKWV